MSLPAWNEDRSAPARGTPAEATEGLLLAASEGRAFWAPTRGGRMTTALRPLERAARRTGHVGWLSVTARSATPWITAAAGSPGARAGRSRTPRSWRPGASTRDPQHSNRLWDLGPILPLFEALGFRLFHWPDLGDPPADFVDLFDAELSAHDDLWLVCRDRDQAADLATAIRRA